MKHDLEEIITNIIVGIIFVILAPTFIIGLIKLIIWIWRV